jgi:hypothetical protein
MKKEKPFVKYRKAASAQQNTYGYQLIPVKKIPIQEAMHLLRNAGIDVREEEAEEIMEFLYTLTQITIKEFFSLD